eukprot:CAMPEP_0201593264 /NCGR_PEP_ID=MMETSP0190_2-20130828/190926_1 /ASSEMBLY_ACC=CAM_ASM_000263 /TAXON_ID=37353 /ORGANISM="Rosalina sp." /LENGTH=758 /DNA_ID=CAMNT_0048052395 /DNA_START=45 /DNA_END=2319 /DNA_ORIENTATION=-
MSTIFTTVIVSFAFIMRSLSSENSLLPSCTIPITPVSGEPSQFQFDPNVLEELFDDDVLQDILDNGIVRAAIISPNSLDFATVAEVTIDASGNGQIDDSFEIISPVEIGQELLYYLFQTNTLTMSTIFTTVIVSFAFIMRTLSSENSLLPSCTIPIHPVSGSPLQFQFDPKVLEELFDADVLQIILDNGVFVPAAIINPNLLDFASFGVVTIDGPGIGEIRFDFLDNSPVEIGQELAILFTPTNCKPSNDPIVSQFQFDPNVLEELFDPDVLQDILDNGGGVVAVIINPNLLNIATFGVVTIDGSGNGQIDGNFGIVSPVEIGQELVILFETVNCKPSNDPHCAQFTCESIDGVSPGSSQMSQRIESMLEAHEITIPMAPSRVHTESEPTGDICNFPVDRVDTILGTTDWAPTIQIFGEAFPAILIYNERTKMIDLVEIRRSPFPESGAANQGYLDSTLFGSQFQQGDKVSIIGRSTICDLKCAAEYPRLTIDGSGNGQIDGNFGIVSPVEIGQELVILFETVNCKPSNDPHCAQFTCESIDGVAPGSSQMSQRIKSMLEAHEMTIPVAPSRVHTDSEPTGSICNFPVERVDTILGTSDWAPTVLLYNERTKIIDLVEIRRFPFSGSVAHDQGYLFSTSGQPFQQGDKVSIIGRSTVCDLKCAAEYPRLDTYLNECSEQYEMDIAKLTKLTKFNTLGLIALGIKTKLLVRLLSFNCDGIRGNYQLDGADSYDSSDSSSSKSGRSRYSRKKKYRNARST